ncbi:MAG: sodium:calcium antiporter [Candidatus Aenigmatarchaeota archaeon]
MVMGITGILPNLGVVVTSLIILVFGAEELIKSLTSLAKRFDISDVFIAMTLVSVGTSLPEITAHVISSLGILSGILNYEIASSAVLGGNIGSDVVQQTLVVGLVVIAMGGLKFEKDFLKKDYLPMIGTTLLTLVLCVNPFIFSDFGILSRWDGLVLLGSFLGYMYFLWKKQSSIVHKHPERSPSESVPKDLLVTLIGMAAILVSAHIALSATQELVKMTGLSGSMIGVATLGIASALPEMFTAISGIKHKAAGISLGTLIGSNITNPLLGIGLGSLISTYYVPKPLYLWDLPMETITAGLLLIYLLFHHEKLGRLGGVYLIGLYIFYIIIRFMFFPVD